MGIKYESLFQLMNLKWTSVQTLLNWLNVYYNNVVIRVAFDRHITNKARFAVAVRKVFHSIKEKIEYNLTAYLSIMPGMSTRPSCDKEQLFPSARSAEGWQVLKRPPCVTVAEDKSLARYLLQKNA
jgi:hypothetical protein